MATTSLEALLKIRMQGPDEYPNGEYFASRPEVLERFNNPKTIVDALPQAVDSEHPFHNAFWSIIFNGGYYGDEEDLYLLLSSKRELDEEGGEEKRKRADVISAKFALWSDW